MGILTIRVRGWLHETPQSATGRPHRVAPTNPDPKRCYGSIVVEHGGAPGLPRACRCIRRTVFHALSFDSIQPCRADERNVLTESSCSSSAVVGKKGAPPCAPTERRQ